MLWQHHTCAVGTCTRPMHSNEWPRTHYTAPTPTPTSPMWKPHKSASMSRQHHQMALSASNDVAGAWECFSTASSSAPGSIITPYAATRPLLYQRHQKCQNTWAVKNHPRVSCLLRPPSYSAIHGTNKDHPPPLHAAETRRKNAKTPPASPEYASALPGDVGDNQVQLCTQF